MLTVSSGEDNHSLWNLQSLELQGQKAEIPQVTESDDLGSQTWSWGTYYVVGLGYILHPRGIQPIVLGYLFQDGTSAAMSNDCSRSPKNFGR